MEYILSVENKCKFCDWTAETGTPTIAITEDQKIDAFCPVCCFELKVSMQKTVEEFEKSSLVKERCRP